MKVNKTIIAAFAAITLAGGTAATAAATANTVAPQATNVSQAAQETPANSDAPAAADRPAQDSTNKGERGKRGGMKGHKGHEKLAETLGVTVEELKAAREADKSIAELAADKGISLDDLKAKLQASAKERLDKAVADGKITQEQADQRLAKMAEKGNERLTTKPSERPERPGKGERGKRGGMKGHKGHEKLAETLGVTVEELKAAREADKSIAELAADKGISLDDLKAKLQASAKERLDKAVADGKITQEQADQRLAKMAEKGNERLTTKPSERPERPGKSKRGGMKGPREAAQPSANAGQA